MEPIPATSRPIPRLLPFLLMATALSLHPTHAAGQPPLERSGVVSAGEGSWVGIKPPGRALSTAIYDPIRNRMVVFGGLEGDDAPSNDVWTLSLHGDAIWAVLTTSGTPPPPRYRHSAIYDPVRDRMIVFGGQDHRYRREVWALSLGDNPTWSDITPAGISPDERHGHTAIYDPVRDRMIVYAGYDNWELADVWALSLAGEPAWSRIVTAAGVPTPRSGHTAIYDPVRDRMVIYGGRSFRDRLSDLWALSLSGTPAWNRIVTSDGREFARAYHTSLYDPVNDRMLVLGGSYGASLPDTVWALQFAEDPAWIATVSEGHPTAINPASAVFDSQRNRVLVLSGNDTWALSLTGTWSAVGPIGAPRSYSNGSSTIYDSRRGRLVVLTGNETWTLALDSGFAWSRLDPPGVLPPVRRYHTAIYDPVRDRMVVFGGDGGGYRRDVWVLPFSNDLGWRELHFTGLLPLPRSGHTAIYDPVRDCMVIFGGAIGFERVNDAWALSLAGVESWSVLQAGSRPPARSDHSATYDPVRDRMIIFGGYDGASRSNDVWSLSLGTPSWSALTPMGVGPSPRSEHTATYDPIRDRLVVFGGNDIYRRNDLWGLTLDSNPSWTALAPSGAPPPPYRRYTAAYDPLRERMIVLGGDHNYAGGVWGLDWGQTTATLLARFEAEVTRDGVRLRWNFAEPERVASTMLERASSPIGPWAPLSLENDRDVQGTGALDPTAVAGVPHYYRLTATLIDGTRATFGPIQAIAAQEAVSNGLIGIVPNPASARTRIDFAVAREERVRVSVVDVMGREVAVLMDGSMSPGRYSVSWDVRGGNTRRQAGVYFVRWASAGATMTRRLVIVN